MGTSKYVREKDQKKRWKLSKCRDTQDEELEEEMFNGQGNEDAPKKEEEFLRQNMCAGRRACLR